MGNHDAFIQDLTGQGVRALDRIDDLKRFLAFVEVDSNQRISVWQSAQRDARALAIICSMAELEALTKSTLQGVHREINNSSLPVELLIPSVRQLTAHTIFESLKELQDPAKMWEKRSYATTLETCSEIAVFPILNNHPQPPLDGKTLKPQHFERLWSIYSIPGYAFPKSTWNASLTKLSLARNDLAHGNLPFYEIFQQAGRSVSEIERYVNDIADFIAHFVNSWEDYMDNERYRK